MTRRVMCMRIDAETRDTVRDELCDIQKKPLDKDTCQMEPCITWTVTAWQSVSNLNLLLSGLSIKMVIVIVNTTIYLASSVASYF